MGAQGRWPFHTAWLGRRGEKGEVLVGRGPHSEGCGGCAEGCPEAGPVCAECEGSQEARWQRTRGSWKDCPLCGAADFRKDGYADGSSRNQLLPSAGRRSVLRAASPATAGNQSLGVAVWIGPPWRSGPAGRGVFTGVRVQVWSRASRRGGGRGGAKGSILSPGKHVSETLMSGKKSFLVPSLELQKHFLKCRPDGKIGDLNVNRQQPSQETSISWGRDGSSDTLISCQRISELMG